MSPIIKTLIVVFGGMAVMVVTTVCGWEIGSMNNGNLFDALLGGAIGAVVGVPIWIWLGYMVCRDKKPAELPPGPPSS
jgi:hypothetical protein